MLLSQEPAETRGRHHDWVPRCHRAQPMAKTVPSLSWLVTAEHPEHRVLMGDSAGESHNHAGSLKGISPTGTPNKGTVLPVLGRSISPCAPWIPHPPTLLRGCSGQGGLGAPASQCPGGASTGHPDGSSIPGDPLITFSPFSPAPPSPTSTCGAERAVRANGVKHQPGGRDDREQSLQFVLGVREDPARRVRKRVTWH